jgi:hypothetical protein
VSVSFQVYDGFDMPGYSLTDYAEKWLLPYGLGEMAVNDDRNFSDGYLSLGAVPFKTTSDVSVNDHLKYMAVSSRTFHVPESGTLVLSSDVRASTPGYRARPNPARCLRPLGNLAGFDQPAHAAGVQRTTSARTASRARDERA